MDDIQKRAIESLTARREKLYDGFARMSLNHQQKVCRQGEVIDYLISLVENNTALKEASNGNS